MNLIRFAPAEGVRSMLEVSVGLVVLVVTLAVFVVVGLRAHRPGDDVEDYVIARNSQGTLTLGLSFLAAGTGAWILFAPPEVGAGVGLVGVLGYALGTAAPMIVFALIGRRMRAVVPAGHTLTEFVRLRFGRIVHAWVIGTSIAYMFLFVTAELTAAGAVGATLAGIPAWVTILAVTVSTLAYTTVGGLRASLRTDRFQAWLILGLLIACCAALTAALPAPGRAWSGSGLLGVDRGGLEVAVTLVIAVLAANLLHQGYWQRVWAARDPMTLRRAAAVGSVTIVPVVFLVGAMGILAAGAGLDLGAPPAPVFALLAGLPGWVVGGVLVLGVALVASSVDTLQIGLASLVVAEGRARTLGTARALTVALMVPAVAIALQGFSVLRLFLIADVLCAGVVVPALLGLWRRATPAGALAGAAAGLVGAVLPGLVATGSLAEGVLRATFPGAVPTLPPFAGAVLASAAVAITVSLAGRRSTDLEEIGAQVRPLTPEPALSTR